jgi:hypothetical protein
VTPSMQLSDIKRKYRNHVECKTIWDDLDEAMHLGHVFGLERVVGIMDELEGSEDGAVLLSTIRALKAERVRPSSKCLKIASEVKQMFEDGRVTVTIVDGAITNITIRA